MYYKILSKNKFIFMQPPQKENFTNIYWVVGIVILKKIIMQKNWQKNFIKLAFKPDLFSIQ